ncbi:MAG: tRNA (N6-threonylcarbamoyladenosine(37)-N6)-methyltransferase TrmO [Planctomycetes bacterium]|nr:tRNA (N6-threonylcarbamoyladenosine(37)-N6)-methyltransferase TrmO [Planctomycetota bacterium]
MVKRPSRLTRPRYTLPDDQSFTIKPIGVVHSPFQWRDEAPRQANVGEAHDAVIVLRSGLQNALKDLIGFDYCWILFWFHWSHGWKQQIVPPRDTVKRGLFATRSPDRPTPIGLSAVRLVAIDGPRITIRGMDILNGTPVLDIKPYIPAYDAFPKAKSGWVDGLTAPGPDHRYTVTGGKRKSPGG